MRLSDLPPKSGVSFKPEHFSCILEEKPPLGFFEIHAENYMGEGGLPHHQLMKLRENYAISLHGVALSLGGSNPLDKAHLTRLKTLIDRYQPASFSEHLAWSSHDEVYYNDLLPLPYTKTTLEKVASHISETQDFLKTQLLLENPSTYILFETSDMSETDFLKALVKQTGCGLLLDVNNVFVSSTNHQLSPYAYLENFPLHAVKQVHLGGHAEEQTSDGQPLLIDAHDRATDDAVWALYKYVLEKKGRTPTLIEWDNDVPPFKILQEEALKASKLLETSDV